MTQDLKPGQRYPTPTKGFGDRVFYETLLRQNPQSIMAQEWCLFYGVLPTEEAEKLYKIYLKRKGKSPSSAATASSETNKGTKRAKVKKLLDDENGFDSGIGTNGNQGIASMTL